MLPAGVTGSARRGRWFVSAHPAAPGAACAGADDLAPGVAQRRALAGAPFVGRCEENEVRSETGAEDTWNRNMNIRINMKNNRGNHYTAARRWNSWRWIFNMIYIIFREHI